MTLQELLTQYIVMIRPLQSVQTVRTKEGFINKHILPKFGDMDVSELTYPMLQTFVNDLLIDLKPKTVKNILDVIKVVYKLAIRLNLVIDNPCDFVELPKYDNKRYFSFSTAVQTAIFSLLILSKYISLPSLDKIITLLSSEANVS